jgi:hypothetical protein
VHGRESPLVLANPRSVDTDTGRLLRDAHSTDRLHESHRLIQGLLDSKVNIFFDLDGTLLDQRASVEKAARAFRASIREFDEFEPSLLQQRSLVKSNASRGSPSASSIGEA